MKKLRSKTGETLVETLFAILIVVLSLTALPISIEASARINRQAIDASKHCNMVAASATDLGNSKVTVSIDNDSLALPYSANVTLYQDENGFYFYQ